ncbi:MAG: glycosyltransferase family 2 protein, partial [Clostridia bacterium]
MKKDNSAQDERIILSIIIPIYNAEKFIKACLESIVIQN